MELALLYRILIFVSILPCKCVNSQFFCFCFCFFFLLLYLFCVNFFLFCVCFTCNKKKIKKKKFHRLFQIHFALAFAATSSHFSFSFVSHRTFFPFNFQVTQPLQVFSLSFFPFPVFSSFHSCHLYSLIICNFVLLLATVIVIRYNCNKDELEPWTILRLFATIFR